MLWGHCVGDFGVTVWVTFGFLRVFSGGYFVGTLCAANPLMNSAEAELFKYFVNRLILQPDNPVIFFFREV